MYILFFSVLSFGLKRFVWIFFFSIKTNYLRISGKAGGFTTNNSRQNSSADINQHQRIRNSSAVSQQKDILINNPSMLNPFADFNLTSSQIHSKIFKNFSPFKNGSSSLFSIFSCGRFFIFIWLSILHSKMTVVFVK